MTIGERIRRALGSVRSGTSEMARVANLKLDLRNLEGRRERLYRTIGRRAHDLHRQGRGVPAFDRLVGEIEEVETEITATQDALRGVRERASGDPPPSPA